MFVQVIFIDPVLAGRNAIVLGMAAASVPIDRRRRGIIWGTAAAVVGRLLSPIVSLGPPVGRPAGCGADACQIARRPRKRYSPSE